MLICYTPKKFTAEHQEVIDRANAILADYEDQGYTLTLRQLYYQFVARDLIENTDRSYKRLGGIISAAREAGQVSWRAIEDRNRSLEAYQIEEDPTSVLNGIEYGITFDIWKALGAYVEVWVEKDALSNVVERACRELRVPFLACRGYLSASEAWRAGVRFRQAQLHGQRTCVIHLGDHDPSGLDMTRDNRERLSLFGRGRVEVRRIALNMDQVDEYGPPPNPTKVTDSRAGEYLAEHGQTSWELDALEPRVIEGLVRQEIETFVDRAIVDDVLDREREAQRLLSMLAPNWDDVSTFLEGLDGDGDF